MMTTRTILLSYLDSCRKPEDKDPLHKWIASYNVKCIILSRFFKWLYYSNAGDPKRRSLLAKPFIPYIRRHSALTEKSVKLKSNTLNQHAGWSMNSHMAQKYIHYFGNESSDSLLEVYGMVTKNNVPIDTLNPKICPNCNGGNTIDSKFCSKCKKIMTLLIELVWME